MPVNESSAMPGCDFVRWRQGRQIEDDNNSLTVNPLSGHAGKNYRLKSDNTGDASLRLFPIQRFRQLIFARYLHIGAEKLPSASPDASVHHGHSFSRYRFVEISALLQITPFETLLHRSRQSWFSSWSAMLPLSSGDHDIKVASGNHLFNVFCQANKISVSRKVQHQKSHANECAAVKV